MKLVLCYLTLSHFVAGETRDKITLQRDEDRTLQVGRVGRVTRIRLINATAGNKGQALIDPILNGTVVNMANFPIGQKFSIEAVTSNVSGPVGSVQFMFGNETQFLTESSPPYALCKDDDSVFRPCPQLVVGRHTVGATPYSLEKSTGIKGDKSGVSFRIISSPIEAPKATPVAAPIPVVAPKAIPVPIPKSTPVKVPIAPIPVAVPKSTPVKVPVAAPIPVAIPKSTPVKAPVAAPIPMAVPKSIPVKAPVVTPIPVAIPKSTPVKVPIAPIPVAVPKSTPVIAPMAPIPVVTPIWVEVNPNAPIDARHEACFVMVGRKAYLLAGRGKQAVNIYDPVTRTWTNGTAPPIQIHHTQCIARHNSIWIVSSWTGGYPNERNVDNIYIYNTLTDTWSTKTGLPENRRRGGAAAVLVGDKIYVSHGNRGGHETANHSTTLGWLDYYDISEDQWYTNLADAPNPRDHVGGGYVNGRICVAGGRDGGDIDFFRKVILPTDCYDPATNTWTEEANIPAGRAGASYGTTCDGKLMVAGGEGGSKTAAREAWANVDVFDGKSWTSVPNLNVARHGAGLAVDCSCNQIYIASGARTQGGRNEITSVETFFLNGVDAQCAA